MEITINNEELAHSLFTLAVLLAHEGTDNCDITLKTSNGNINCYIEFSTAEDEDF